MFLTRNRKWRRILLSHNLHLRSSPGRAPLARPPSPTRAQRSPRLPPWSAPPAKRTCSGLPCCFVPCRSARTRFRRTNRSRRVRVSRPGSEVRRIRSPRDDSPLSLQPTWRSDAMVTSGSEGESLFFSFFVVGPPPAGGKVKRSTN